MRVPEKRAELKVLQEALSEGHQQLQRVEEVRAGKGQGGAATETTRAGIVSVPVA